MFKKLFLENFLLKYVKDSSIINVLLHSVILIILNISNYQTLSIDLKCNFNNDWNYQVLGDIYRCQVMKNLNITTLNDTYIDSASGAHKHSHFTANKRYIGYSKYHGHQHVTEYTKVYLTDSSVRGIEMRGMTIEYFPSGIHNIFEHIKLIIIQDCHLMSIDRNNLTPFTELEVLDLEGNEIVVLRQGLFDTNVHLSWISLAHNKIHLVDMNVFEKLGSLATLNFIGNKCLSPNIAYDSAAVKQLLNEIKDSCQDVDYHRINEIIKDVRRELETVKLKNFEQFSNKLCGLDKDLKSSQWINFQQLINDVDNLTNHKKFLNLENLHLIDTKIKELEVSDMPQRVENIELELTDFNETIAIKLDQKICELEDKIQKFNTKFAAFMVKVENNLNKDINEDDEDDGTEFRRIINAFSKMILRKIDRKIKGIEKRANVKN